MKHETLLLGQVETLWLTMAIFEPQFSEHYLPTIMRPCILYIVTHESPPVVLKETGLLFTDGLQMWISDSLLYKDFFSLWQLNLSPLGLSFRDGVLHRFRYTDLL
jgi:hypothetical protein